MGEYAGETMRLLILVCLLASLALVESRRRYKSYLRSRPRHSYGRRYKVHRHRHTHDYYEPTYEKTYEIPYEPRYEEIYEPDYDYEYEPRQQDNRVSTTSSTSNTGLGGLDLAAALGLTGVGYVANSGGALHIVGKLEAESVVPDFQFNY